MRKNEAVQLVLVDQADKQPMDLALPKSRLRSAATEELLRRTTHRVVVANFDILSIQTNKA